MDNSLAGMSRSPKTIASTPTKPTSRSHGRADANRARQSRATELPDAARRSPDVAVSASVEFKREESRDFMDLIFRMLICISAREAHFFWKRHDGGRIDRKRGCAAQKK